MSKCLAKFTGLALLPALFVFCAQVFYCQSCQSKETAAKAVGEAAKPGLITWQKDLPSALKLAAKSGKPLIVDFYIDNCRWCRKLDHDVFEHPTIGRQLKNRAIFVKVNAERSQEEINFAKKNTNGSMPTVAVLEVSTKGTYVQRWRLEKYLPPERFLVEILNYL